MLGDITWQNEMVILAYVYENCMSRIFLTIHDWFGC